MKSLQDKLNYKFKNENLLKNALCHSSYANEVRGGVTSNERLEFLGDSVLSIVVSEHIFLRYPEMPEGELSRLRSSLVCEKALCESAKDLGLGDYLLLGKGESKGGGRERPSILADAFEAVIAAIYLDGGIEPVKKHIERYVIDKLDKIGVSIGSKDYKTVLQEIIQKNPEENISYCLIDEKGPEHNKTFTVEVRLNSNVIGKGTGSSKQNAEEEAAKQALSLMGQFL